jgi:hypothetical protein
MPEGFTTFRKCARFLLFAAPPPLPRLFMPFQRIQRIEPCNFIREFRVKCSGRFFLRY